MAGLILLLLLGTQILDWPWVAALLAASLVLGVRNLRRDTPSSYAVAQSIDRRLGLCDSLSTAFFYQRLEPGRKVSEEIRAAQFAEAELLAREAPLDRAAPFAAPRSLYAVAALGLVAAGLLTLRYGISRSLDLRPPLARMVFDTFHFAAQAQRPAARSKNASNKRMNELLKQFGLSLDNSADQPGERGQTAGTTLETDSAPEARRESARSHQGGLQPLQAGEQRQDETKEGSKPPGEESSQQSQSASQPDSRGDSPGRPSSRRQTANSSSENDSLLDKFRDAMANLLSRLKPQPRSGDGQQMASSAQGRSDQGQSQQGQKGSVAGQQAQGQQSGDPQDEQPGEGFKLPQGGQGKQGGPDAEQISRDGRSGIGKEDGSKEVREAEQLAAMGKISEIIGKRSQNLTGEVMVEVASSKQQLRTAYSQQNLSHSEAGGEIHRDEIPLAYQHYVQQYFEEIRKPAPPAKPKQP